MKGVIRLITATEFTEGKQVIHGGWVAKIMNYADSLTCDINIKNKYYEDQKRVRNIDLKIMVVEYHLKPMPEDRRFKRGYSITQYNNDMDVWEASKRTIVLNPSQWQAALDNGVVNRKVDFTDDDGVGNIAILRETQK